MKKLRSEALDAPEGPPREPRELPYRDEETCALDALVALDALDVWLITVNLVQNSQKFQEIH